MWHLGGSVHLSICLSLPLLSFPLILTQIFHCEILLSWSCSYYFLPVITLWSVSPSPYLCKLYLFSKSNRRLNFFIKPCSCISSTLMTLFYELLLHKMEFSRLFFGGSIYFSIRLYDFWGQRLCFILLLYQLEFVELF